MTEVKPTPKNQFYKSIEKAHGLLNTNSLEEIKIEPDHQQDLILQKYSRGKVGQFDTLPAIPNLKLKQEINNLNNHIDNQRMVNDSRKHPAGLPTEPFEDQILKKIKFNNPLTGTKQIHQIPSNKIRPEWRSLSSEQDKSVMIKMQKQYLES